MKIDIQNILEKIKTVKIAVFGDLCLDAYWMMDPDGGEVSVETGLKTQAVREQKYTLGGGANIIANLAALNPAEIKAIGAVGDDMFGYEMLRQFKDININTLTSIFACSRQIRRRSRIPPSVTSTTA